MGKSLYRSYRSKSFDEIVGQDHITITLKNALKNKAIAHAYLLSGPRGVGKTSVARILAYAVNGIEYDLEGTNLDIIEIDAASNRRIDEVREIRDKVRIAPSSGKYKVYIVDEVHMLTKEAFNALLKTLEEPPEHAIFILATTEPSKLPDTIISRCIHFSFKAIDPDTIAKHLREIADKEKIKISDEAIKLLAKHSQGSFRDALSLLQQVNYISNDISEADVSLMLGMPSSETIKGIVASLEKGDVKSLSDSLADAYNFGSSPSNIASQLLAQLREIFTQNKSSVLSKETILDIQQDLLTISGAQQANLKLELVLSRYALQNSTKTTEPVVVSESTIDEQPKKPVLAEATRPTQTETIKTTPNTNPKKDDSWDSFLQLLKKKNNTLYGVMRLAKFEIHDQKITLSFKFGFHKKQVDDKKNKAVLMTVMRECYEKPMTIDTQLLNQDTAKPGDINLTNVSNIFGSAEVLES